MKKLLIVIAVLFVLIAAACSVELPGSTPTPVVVERTVVVPQTVVVRETAAPAATTASTTTPTAIPPTAIPTTRPTSVPANVCKDGSHPQPTIADQARIPAGTKEGPVVAEVSWKPGNGFGGIDRVVIVLPKWDSGVAINILNAYTVYYTQYCGEWGVVKNYAKTHIAAMVQSAADPQGNTPEREEIGVYALVDLNSNALEVVQAASKGPSLAEIKSHIEVVRIVR